jgi:hypothetical protein
VSVGVDDVVLNTNNPALFQLIPTCVLSLLGMYTTKTEVATNEIRKRLLLLDITLGFRLRILRYNGNGMAQWMRVIQGTVLVYCAPCTSYNYKILTSYYRGDLNCTPLEVIQHLHFVFKHVLMPGDVLLLPPNCISFELTPHSSVVVHGDFFVGAAATCNILFKEPFLFQFRYSNFQMVYIELGNRIIDFIRKFPHVKSVKNTDILKLGHFVYRMLLSIASSFPSICFDNEQTTQFGNALTQKDYLNVCNGMLSSCINSLWIICQTSLVCHIQKALSENIWIVSQILLGGLTKIDLRLLATFFSTEQTADRFRMLVHQDALYVLDFVKYRKCIEQRNQWMDNVSLDLGDAMQCDKSFHSVMTEVMTSTHSDEHKLTLHNVVGFITDYQISLLTLFNIVYIHTDNPSSMMTAFINDFYDPARFEHFRCVPESMMNFKDRDQKLDSQTLLSVDEILGFLYAVATPANVQAFYRFTRLSLQHNKRGTGPKHFDYFLVGPIKIKRWGCDDVWIHGFLHICHYDDFMKQFTLTTHTFDNVFKVSSTDIARGIIVRKNCLICTKMVLHIMRSDDEQIMIVKFHICSHPIVINPNST